MSRILAFDYGLKRTGVAVTDPDRIVITPLEQLLTTEQDFSAKVQKLIQEYSPGMVLIGWPAHDNKILDIHQAIQIFREKLQVQYPQLQVVYQDESFSSAEANRIYTQKHGSSGNAKKKIAQKKKQIDSLAASLILESYLQTRDFPSAHSGSDPEQTQSPVPV